MTIELGSEPVLTLAILVSVLVSNTEIESVSGLTIATNRSLPVIATVLDFDGRASTGVPVPPSGGASSPPLLQPASDAPAASMAIQRMFAVMVRAPSPSSRIATCVPRAAAPAYATIQPVAAVLHDRGHRGGAGRPGPATRCRRRAGGLCLLPCSAVPSSSSSPVVAFTAR